MLKISPLLTAKPCVRALSSWGFFCVSCCYSGSGTLNLSNLPNFRFSYCRLSGEGWPPGCSFLPKVNAVLTLSSRWLISLILRIVSQNLQPTTFTFSPSIIQIFSRHMSSQSFCQQWQSGFKVLASSTPNSIKGHPKTGSLSQYRAVPYSCIFLRLRSFSPVFLPLALLLTIFAIT